MVSIARDEKDAGFCPEQFIFGTSIWLVPFGGGGASPRRTEFHGGCGSRWRITFEPRAVGDNRPDLNSALTFSLEPNGSCTALVPVFLAVIRQAAEAASASQGPLHGYPPWLIVLGGAIIAAVALWIFAKLLKLTIWVAILLVLIGGAVVAAKMLMGA